MALKLNASNFQAATKSPRPQEHRPNPQSRTVAQEEGEFCQTVVPGADTDDEANKHSSAVADATAAVAEAAVAAAQAATLRSGSKLLKRGEATVPPKFDGSATAPPSDRRKHCFGVFSAMRSPTG
ncbi:hypothetical protein Salat_2649200 [Sesamum alatum]|uniref:Uncharacterized protein n=1 Tax=Sesamum alatum TaxID=300844 RepID=A0AAE1XP16_9LAMI|nr:hypothetical protein Salat_2649200 [Sesamum alatum]